MRALIGLFFTQSEISCQKLVCFVNLFNYYFENAATTGIYLTSLGINLPNS